MDDSHDLVRRLMTLAGMLLEDASAQAILGDERDAATIIARVTAACDDARALAAAAAVVRRVSDD